MKKKDIYKLKRCLRDFKTKDHVCLFPNLLSLEYLFKMVYRAPQCWAWALSLCSCFLHLVEHHDINFFFLLWIFGSFGFFFMPPALFGHLQWLRIFFYAPQCCLGTFTHWGFFFSIFFFHLPPVWGVILAKVIYLKKSIWL